MNDNTIKRRLLNMTFVVGDDFGVLYETKLSKTKRLYEIVERLNHNRHIAKVLLIQTSFKAWEFDEIEVEPKYVNQGIGTDLIIKLCKHGLCITQKCVNVNKHLWQKVRDKITVYRFSSQYGNEDFEPFHLEKEYESNDHFLIAKSVNSLKQNQIEKNNYDKNNFNTFRRWQHGLCRFPVLPISFSNRGDY